VKPLPRLCVLEIAKMEKKAGFVYYFNTFSLDPLTRSLTRNGDPVALTPLAFNTLLLLIENRDRLVTKTELLNTIWPDTFSDDTNLAVMISTVRKALGDSGRAQSYIVTVAKSGYRFVAEIHPVLRTNPNDNRSQELLPDQPAPQPSIERPLRFAKVFASAVLAVFGGLLITKLYWETGSPIASNSRATAVPATFAANGLGAGARPGDIAQAWYLKGRYCWSRGTERGLKQSIVYFQNAIAENPRNAMAYAGLADAYQSLATWSVQSSEVSYREASEAARRAVDLDDSLSQSHSALGMIAMVHGWNFPEAQKEFLQAVKLAPNDAIAHQRLGTYLAATGKLGDALMEMRRARDLDPLSLNIGIDVGRMFYYSRKYPETIAEYRKVIELDPHYSVAHYYLGIAYFVQSDFKNAIQELGESSRLVGDREPLAFGLYAAARAKNGDRAFAESVLAQLLERSTKEYVSPLSLAWLYLNLGQRVQALDWFEKTFRDHIITSVFSGVEPLFDQVRNEPRFQAFSRRVLARSEALPLVSRAGESPRIQTVRSLLNH
jgi:DNA-binding winged helix-turn-helix (wHTH) protein